MDTYLDTSALAKWYLNEPFSDEVEAFLTKHEGAAISRLGVVEFRCLLARRRRAGEIDARLEADIAAAFAADIGAGALAVHAVEDADFGTAERVIGSLRKHPLRTLDALHLSIAARIGVELVATADRVMAAACKDLKLRVALFA